MRTPYRFVVLFLCVLGSSISLSANEVLRRHENRLAAWIVGELGVVRTPDPDPRRTDEEYYAQVYEALQEGVKEVLAQELEATGAEDVYLKGSTEDDDGLVHFAFGQRVAGLEVMGTAFRIHMDSRTGLIVGFNGRFYPHDEELDPRRMRRLSFESAFERAVRMAEIRARPVSPPELLFLGGGARLELVYRVLVAYGDGMRVFLYIRATDGAFLGAEPETHTAWPPPPGNSPPTPSPKQDFRTFATGVLTALCDLTVVFPVPGFLTAAVCTSYDAAANRAQKNQIQVFRYYSDQHGRQSYDDGYADLVSVVHALINGSPNNAGWSTTQKKMSYGDGDGSLFKDFTLGFDVVAHELTHAVTQATSGLKYKNESGALNEAMSDIFAAAAESWDDGGINADTWLVGEDIVGPSWPGSALRYMHNPALDGNSPDFYPERLYPDPCTASPNNDFCGVHYNSGIANLAFYLLVQGGSHPNGKTNVVVTGIGMELAAEVFYLANRDYLNTYDGFSDARLATETAAAVFGPAIVQSVSDAWDAVGVP